MAQTHAGRPTTYASHHLTHKFEQNFLLTNYNFTHHQHCYPPNKTTTTK